MTKWKKCVLVPCFVVRIASNENDVYIDATTHASGGER